MLEARPGESPSSTAATTRHHIAILLVLSLTIEALNHSLRIAISESRPQSYMQESRLSTTGPSSSASNWRRLFPQPLWVPKMCLL